MGLGNVVVMRDKMEHVSKKQVSFYNDTGAEVTLRGGYAVCYDQDYGDATAVDFTRASRVLKPATANLGHFAGVISEEWDGTVVANGKQHNIEINDPVKGGQKVSAWTDQSVELDVTILYVEDGNFSLTDKPGIADGEKYAVARALQTVDRSTDNGTTLVLLVGLENEFILQEAQADAGGYSPAIWNQMPMDDIIAGKRGFVFEDDFLGGANLVTAEGWVLTTVTSGTIALSATEVGGALVVSSGAHNAADDGAQAQLLNCRVLPVAGTKIAFEARVQMNDATDQYFVGLAATDTTLIAAGVLDDVSDKAGFFHAVSETDDKISTVTARAAADDATSDVADNADGTYVTLGFVIDGLTSIKFYVNGVLVETGATVASIPSAAMCLSLVSQIEATGANAELTIDRVRVAQDVRV